MTAAILLAGGRATRLGGRDKPQLEVGGRSLLQHALAAVDGCAPVVIVSDPVAGVTGVRWVREQPRFGGPAAAVVAGVGALGESGNVDAAALPEWTVLLACDLPRAGDAIARVLRDLPLLPADTDGVCLADPTSRPQWLTGAYRTAALRRAAAALPDAGAGASMRDLLADLAIAVVTAPADETADVDTWEDLYRARAQYGGPDEERS
ncbi:molybdenum cofactor guanylyltransferase [Microbacterium invictum]|uniref:Molybdopterin-guanine dinucleotide biosynthesis protein A n=1 Tax=Microbacterium invictum TaxID=515415 RepID=A0AA40SLD5_9MICO|nr:MULTISPECIES: NTP transferase domain-containing protein [Microbacterium]MBB4138368.1 molybdopterin-guanine dinucleotide biosynthesis protein A [Microbacterium invictum]